MITFPRTVWTEGKVTATNDSLNVQMDVWVLFKEGKNVNVSQEIYLIGKVIEGKPMENYCNFLTHTCNNVKQRKMERFSSNMTLQILCVWPEPNSVVIHHKRRQGSEPARFQRRLKCPTSIFILHEGSWGKVTLWECGRVRLAAADV